MTVSAGRNKGRLDQTAGGLTCRIDGDLKRRHHSIHKTLHVTEDAPPILRRGSLTRRAIVAQVNICTAETKAVAASDRAGGLKELIGILRTAFPIHAGRQRRAFS